MINMSFIVYFFQIFFFAIPIMLLIATTYLLVKKISRDDCSIKMDELYQKIKNDINFSVVPNFIDLSPV
jgi:hypothetical protein